MLLTRQAPGQSKIDHNRENGSTSEPDNGTNGATPENDHVVTRMFFLGRDDLYKTVKPYSIRYDIPVCIPQDNIRRVECSVTVQDLRKMVDSLSFEQCCFRVLPFQSLMEYGDYESEDKIRGIHIPEVLACVKDAFGADDIHALEHVLRRRHPTWPIATGDTYDFEQPASRAHIDFTHEAVVDIIRHLYEDQAEEVLAGKWQVINAWHPLTGPTRDWPLAICDASTVDFENDAVPGDVVQADRVTENLQIHFDERQKWYYLSDQMPSEMLVFKNADSESPIGASWGAPHASFNISAEAPGKVPARESIEVRILVMWQPGTE